MAARADAEVVVFIPTQRVMGSWGHMSPDEEFLHTGGGRATFCFWHIARVPALAPTSRGRPTPECCSPPHAAQAARLPAGTALDMAFAAWH